MIFVAMEVSCDGAGCANVSDQELLPYACLLPQQNRYAYRSYRDIADDLRAEGWEMPRRATDPCYCPECASARRDP